MYKIKCYGCECGEEIYEDDMECVNCGKPVDPSKFKEEPLIQIISQGEVEEITFPRTKDCDGCRREAGPSHDGSKNCKSGSIASGGTKAHCSCDTCF